MRVRVREVGVGTLLANSAKAREAALFALAENVLSDCSTYVPHMTGDLERSGTAKVSGGRGQVAWGTTADTAKYARFQYYGVGLSHDTPGNRAYAPKACAKWFEAARAARNGSWEKLFGKVLKEGMHG